MKTVLITGVGRGIGRALAEKFLAENYLVLGTTQTGEAPYAHKNLVIYKLDLSSLPSIEECAKKIIASEKKIDIFINNAGVLLDEDETRVKAELLRQTLEVNLTGLVDFTERLVPNVNHGGHILNISSTAGSLTLAGRAVSHYPHHYPAYKISKAALNMYTRTLSLELKAQNITVSSVHPGWVKTDMGGEEADVTPQESAEDIYKIATAKKDTGEFWFKGSQVSW